MMNSNEFEKYVTILGHVEEFSEIDKIFATATVMAMVESMKPMLDKYEYLVKNDGEDEKDIDERREELNSMLLGLFSSDGKRLDNEDSDKK